MASHGAGGRRWLRAAAGAPTRRSSCCTSLTGAQLVRLAVLLVHDVGTAEEIVQDSFVAVHAKWNRLHDPDKALAYLRQSVVNRSRSHLRHLSVVRRHAEREAPPRPAAGADHAAYDHARRATVLDALRRLPRRQREVLALRYYLDLVRGRDRGHARDQPRRREEPRVAWRRRPPRRARRGAGGDPMSDPSTTTTGCEGCCPTRSPTSSRRTASTSCARSVRPSPRVVPMSRPRSWYAAAGIVATAAVIGVVAYRDLRRR